MPILIWLPFTPITVTVTFLPIIIDSPILRVKISMSMSFAGADLCCDRNYTILPGYKVKSALDAGALSAGCAAVGASGEVAFTLYLTRIPRPRLQDAT